MKGDVDEENEEDQDNDDPDHKQAKPAHAAFKCSFRRSLAKCSSQLRELGSHTSPRDLDERLSTRHAGAEKDDLVFFIESRRHLLYRKRFTGKCRLIHKEILRLDDL